MIQAKPGPKVDQGSLTHLVDLPYPVAPPGLKVDKLLQGSNVRGQLQISAQRSHPCKNQEPNEDFSIKLLFSYIHFQCIAEIRQKLRSSNEFCPNKCQFWIFLVSENHVGMRPNLWIVETQISPVACQQMAIPAQRNQVAMIQFQFWTNPHRDHMMHMNIETELRFQAAKRTIWVPFQESVASLGPFGTSW